MKRMVGLIITLSVLALTANVVLSEGIDEYTTVLVHSNSFDGDTSFVDSSSSGHTFNVMGGVHHSTTQAKFGTSSIYFDGSIGNYLVTPSASSGWQFGSGDFTIDLWFYAEDTENGRELFGGMQETHGTFVGYFYESLFVTVGANCASTGQDCTQGSIGSPALNTWHHLALVRYGDLFTVYIDGISVFSKNTTAPCNLSSCPTAPLRIGDGDVTSKMGYWKGYIDEFRISKGIARWTSNFDPPTEPYDDQPTPPSPSCEADYNLDGVVDMQDLIDRQNYVQQVIQEHNAWVKDCWKENMICQ